MDTTTSATDPIEQAKAQLRKAHPGWSIVHSSAGRWWGFLDTRLRGRDSVPARTTDVDADTPEKLHELLVKAEA